MAVKASRVAHLCVKAWQGSQGGVGKGTSGYDMAVEARSQQGQSCRVVSMLGVVSIAPYRNGN